MKNVLIITYFFPPSNDIASRRFGTMAHYLQKMGLDVHVLTTNSKGNLISSVPEENVIRIGENRQKSAQIEDLSTEKLPSLIEIIRKPARNGGFYLWSLDRTFLTWYRQIKSNLTLIDAKIQTPDIIIGSFGPSACLWAGKYLAKHYRVPWIADIRDLGALRDDERSPLAKRIDVSIETLLLKSASAVITVSNTLRDILKSQYDKPVDVIYNGWDEELNNINAINANGVADSAKKYLYYAGRFYIDQMPAIMLLLDTMVDFANFDLIIRSLGPDSLNSQILHYANEIGLSGRVHLLPPCSQEIVNKEAESSAVNLVLADLSIQTEWTKGTITGKLLELLVRTPPILAIGRYDSEMGEVLQTTVKGRLCSTHSEIKDFLLSIDSCNMKYPGDASNIYGFSRNYQAIKMYDLLNKYL